MVDGRYVDESKVGGVERFRSSKVTLGELNMVDASKA